MSNRLLFPRPPEMSPRHAIPDPRLRDTAYATSEVSHLDLFSLSLARPPVVPAAVRTARSSFLMRFKCEGGDFEP